MITISHLIPLAAALSIVSATGAFAQGSNNPGDSGGLAGARIATPTYPPTADSDPALSPGRLDRGTTGVPADENPNVAGATGYSIVPGDRSTIGRDRRATTEQKTTNYSSDGNGGGN